MKIIKVGAILFLIAQLAMMLLYPLERIEIGETQKDSFYFFLFCFEFGIYNILMMIIYCYRLNYEKEKETLTMRNYIKFLHTETSLKKIFLYIAL